MSVKSFLSGVEANQAFTPWQFGLQFWAIFLQVGNIVFDAWLDLVCTLNTSQYNASVLILI